VEIVRQANAFTNDGDLEASFRLSHPDIEWVVAREHPDARTLVGQEAVAKYQREWEETLPGVRVTLDRLLDVGEKVVAIGTVRGSGNQSGADVSVPIGFVFAFRDGLIARVQEYIDPAEALKAVGLAE
jgi:ketosteroid isomerase-like protein